MADSSSANSLHCLFPGLREGLACVWAEGPLPPWLFSGLGEPEGLGNPDLVHIPMRPLSDPSAGSTGLRHGSLQAPGSPGTGSGPM